MKLAADSTTPLPQVIRRYGHEFPFEAGLESIERETVASARP
jgi:hypothetical protein